MRVIVFLLVVSLMSSCARVETASTLEPPPAPSVSPPTSNTATIPPVVLLKPVEPQVRLKAKEKKYLDESLPREVRKILEAAESFEVFGEIDKDDTAEYDSREFIPNMMTRITNEPQKKEILEAFYFDAAHEDSPAVCYEPRHSLKATAKGKTVEVEICFACARFVVKGIDGDPHGTIVRENRKSEEVLNRILRESGVRIER